MAKIQDKYWKYIRTYENITKWPYLFWNFNIILQPEIGIGWNDVSASSFVNFLKISLNKDDAKSHLPKYSKFLHIFPIYIISWIFAIHTPVFLLLKWQVLVIGRSLDPFRKLETWMYQVIRKKKLLGGRGFR